MSIQNLILMFSTFLVLSGVYNLFFLKYINKCYASGGIKLQTRYDFLLDFYKGEPFTRVLPPRWLVNSRLYTKIVILKNIIQVSIGIGLFIFVFAVGDTQFFNELFNVKI